MMKMSKNFQKILITISFAIPIVVYTLVLSLHVMNIPIYDDYFNVFTHLNFIIENGFLKNLHFYFFEFTDYSFYFYKLVNLLEFLLFQKVNFIHYIILGNIGLLGFFYLLVKHEILKTDWKLILPVGFLLFQFSFWEISFWGLPAINGFWTLFLLLYTVIFYEKKKYYLFYISSVLLVFGTLSNGIAIVPIMILLMLLKKDWLHLKIWLVLSFVFLSIYYYQFKIVPNQFNISIVSPSLVLLLTYFFHLVSNSLLQNGEFLNVLIGVVITILSIFVICYGVVKNNNYLLITLLLFSFVSQVLITLGRGHFGIGQSLSSRYCLYSVLQIMSIAIFFYKFLPISQNLKCFIFIFCTTLIYYNSYKNGMNRFLAWKKHHIELGQSYFSDDQTYFNEFFKEMQIPFIQLNHSNYYTFPEKFNIKKIPNKTPK